jgi:hypothetical protein
MVHCGGFWAVATAGNDTTTNAAAASIFFILKILCMWEEVEIREKIYWRTLHEIPLPAEASEACEHKHPDQPARPDK